ncbi:MAG: hypothetical protein LUH12_06215 [Bacteroides sp.]|nr:hypothetical protein [Bacteroides sp.]
MYAVPILFLIFNRPDTTKIVFDRIREIRPSRLYIAADAPRKSKPKEVEMCLETRSIVHQIDWPCEVKTLFRIENLGCKRAVSEAISWFFEQEEYGVILEDDCLPDLSFFPFCEELLIKYKDDSHIGHIGGNCYYPNAVNADLSYDFCWVTHIWGWATWRRVWKNVDLSTSLWNKGLYSNASLYCNMWEKIYFTSFLSDAIAKRNGLNPWGVFYYFTLRLQHQLSIYPSVNLVTNIGLNDPNATHTKKHTDKFYRSYESISFPMKHPRHIFANKLIDSAEVKKHFFSYKRILRYLLKDY